MNNSQENLYRLIKPYDSNLLHASSTMMGGASKCYKELKKSSQNATNFSIMHMKTNQIYDFDINQNQNINQSGGGTIPTLSEMGEVRNYVASLEKRIIDLENKINGNGENVIKGGNNEDVKVNSDVKRGGSVINNRNPDIPMLNDAPIPPNNPKQYQQSAQPIMTGGIAPPMIKQNVAPNLVPNVMPNMMNQNMMPNMMNQNMMMPNMMNNNFNHNIARKFI